ncbi:MAG: hypothetical protein KF729_04760 [Sandaracinaceae bacterium]|nr:hypothetical protein [Sandaracinaceae bacterium]
MTWELHRTRPYAWSGVCVHPEYCRWLLEQPELTDIRCRYSEGTLFENGPPDQPCGAGADELFGFCGGRCGDTCPDPFDGVPSCVGVSETRGFGVCARSRVRCGRRDGSVAGIPPGGACMLLSPMALPEYAGHGWRVVRETCVAYRARFPEEVRCLGIDGRDL